MNASQLQADLRELAARAPEPSPGLADELLTRCREVRRRGSMLIAAAIAVAVFVAGVPVLLGLLRGSASVAGTVFDLPTRGSLAEDAAFVSGVRELPWSLESNYVAADGSAYTAGTDIAAAVSAAERIVVFAGDVPGGRWALLAIRDRGGYAVAWFTGPAGGAPEELTLSSRPALVSAGDPVAHLDLGAPDRPLVVVAAPGDEIGVSPSAELSRTGMWFRTTRTIEAPEGVAVLSVEEPQGYGTGTRVFVERAGSQVFSGYPTTPGFPLTVPADEVDTALRVRPGEAGPPTAVPVEMASALLRAALGPTALTLTDLGPAPVVELFAGDRMGPRNGRTPTPPEIVIWSVRLPSGAHVVVGGWFAFRSDGSGQYAATFATARINDEDPLEDVLATRMQLPAFDDEPASDVLVIVGPVDGERASVTATVGTGPVTLVDGAAVIPFPAGAESVRVFDATGDVREGVVSAYADLQAEPVYDFPVLISRLG